MSENIIIGITGTVGAGKGTIVDYLVLKKGFKHYSVRAVLTEEIKKRGLEINRDNMIKVADEWRATKSPSYLLEKMYEMATSAGGNAVLERVGAVAELEFLRSKGAIIFAIDADPEIRYNRITSRAAETDKISYEKFLEHEAYEARSDDPTKQSLRMCIEMSDYIFENNYTIEDLNKELECALQVIESHPRYKTEETKNNSSESENNSNEEKIEVYNDETSQNEDNKIETNNPSAVFNNSSAVFNNTSEVVNNISSQNTNSQILQDGKTDYIRPTWDEYFMEVANTISKRATCERGRSGCVIARDKQLLVSGYVGSPVGLPHCDEVGHLFKKTIHEDGHVSNHCVRTVHAEQNAICQAAKLGISLKGSTLYCRMTPCRICAMLIINCGIKRVVCEKKYHAGVESEEMFKDAGVELMFFSEETQKYSNQ